ncbi:MAG TPA: Spi family protease inhibitor, partial [Bacteroidales bacterium]|nr:Spi family protease inhibitor [Bacteroidales bacterium]
MKHFYGTLFSLLLFVHILPAENISLPDAGRVARNFYYERINQYYPLAYDLIKIHDTYVCEEKGNPLLYIFNLENKGYVIVSAQDATYPVLGYSFNGNYQKENSPANLEAWLAFYQRQISYASTTNLQA